MGIHNYYQIATCVNLDCDKIGYTIIVDFAKRLGTGKKGELKKCGKPLHGYIKERYGGSRQMRYINGFPVCPIGYVQTKAPMWKRRSINKYTPEGRIEIHKSLGVNMHILHQLMKNKQINRSIEYMDNRISLYAGQLGKCAVTNRVLEYDEIHCHHIVPVQHGGKDYYGNLTIIHVDVHRLIHATEELTIRKYLTIVRPTEKMLSKINNLRKKAKLPEIK